jgi:hypothetical protein
MAGIALVVDEQHGEIGAGQVGLHLKHAIHVVMAARLEHQKFAVTVEMLAGVAAFGEDRGARNLRIAGNDNAHRLAARMHLDSFDCFAHACPYARPQTASTIAVTS